MSKLKPGDQVYAEGLVANLHGNIATLSYFDGNGDAVVYFGDRDEDEYVYGLDELRPMTVSYRYVLKTPMGEFFSDSVKTVVSPNDAVAELGEASRWLNRIEINKGEGWEVL